MLWCDVVVLTGTTFLVGLYKLFFILADFKGLPVKRQLQCLNFPPVLTNNIKACVRCKFQLLLEAQHLLALYLHNSPNWREILTLL
jgi:hypothetical protein